MSRSINALPASGKAIVEATNRDTWRNEAPDAREICIDKSWTACLLCWGGPLDLSIVVKKYNAYWSHNKRAKQSILHIPIKLSIASEQYTAKLRYMLATQDSCITSPLNDGVIKLGSVMTNAGFSAKQKIFLKFIGNGVSLLSAK